MIGIRMLEVVLIGTELWCSPTRLWYTIRFVECVLYASCAAVSFVVHGRKEEECPVKRSMHLSLRI